MVIRILPHSIRKILLRQLVGIRDTQQQLRRRVGCKVLRGQKILKIVCLEVVWFQPLYNHTVGHDVQNFVEVFLFDIDVEFPGDVICGRCQVVLTDFLEGGDLTLHIPINDGCALERRHICEVVFCNLFQECFRE